MGLLRSTVRHLLGIVKLGSREFLGGTTALIRTGSINRLSFTGDSDNHREFYV
jgi:hypothetical protein